MRKSLNFIAQCAIIFFGQEFPFYGIAAVASLPHMQRIRFLSLLSTTIYLHTYALMIMKASFFHAFTHFLLLTYLLFWYYLTPNTPLIQLWCVRSKWNIAVGRKAFLFFCFLCSNTEKKVYFYFGKTFFYASKSCFY